MRILLIDDDTELCQLVADYLKPMGFAVESAHDGEAGAERAISEAWAAIILDVMMPGCDGFGQPGWQDAFKQRVQLRQAVPVSLTCLALQKPGRAERRTPEKLLVKQGGKLGVRGH